MSAEDSDSGAAVLSHPVITHSLVWSTTWEYHVVETGDQIYPSKNFLKSLFMFFRERRREGEREGEKCVRCVRETSIGCLSQAPKWGPGPAVRPDWEWNQRPSCSQAGWHSIH